MTGRQERGAQPVGVLSPGGGAGLPFSQASISGRGRTGLVADRPGAAAPLVEVLAVVEYGVFVAGPYAAEPFAHGGADVIKVEPTEGDATRFNSPTIPGGGRQYIIKARGKRGIPLDLSHPEGQAIARRLALRSDVVVSNMRRGALSDYGLDYENLSEENPRVIVAEIWAFGRLGPNGGQPGADFQVQAASGLLLSAASFDGDEPRHSDGHLTDYMAGTLLTFGIASALWRRERTGLGQQVGTTLFQAGRCRSTTGAPS